VIPIGWVLYILISLKYIFIFFLLYYIFFHLPLVKELLRNALLLLLGNDFESYNVSCIVVFSIVSCIVYRIELFKIH
jgi:hypothetical protein